MILSHTEIEWLREHHPKISIGTINAGEILSGEFCFDAVWDEIHRCYLINPQQEQVGDLIQIRDCYQIQVLLSNNGGPTRLFETGGRILAQAIKLGLPACDLHMYETGETCPMGEFDREGIVSVPQFLDGPVLQFFYDQSYFERYGRWPRGQYSHGVFGMIENYFEQGQIRSGRLAKRCFEIIYATNDPNAELVRKLLGQKQRVQGHLPCLCGSGKEFRFCHKNLYHGLWALHEIARRIK